MMPYPIVSVLPGTCIAVIERMCVCLASWAAGPPGIYGSTELHIQYVHTEIQRIQTASGWPAPGGATIYVYEYNKQQQALVVADSRRNLDTTNGPGPIVNGATYRCIEISPRGPAEIVKHGRVSEF